MKANEFIIAPENAGKSIVEIMQLFSDQQNAHWKSISDGKQIVINELEKQNRELREIINNVLNKTESDQDVIIIEQGFTLQRLMKELDEVKTSHYQKLDAQLIEDVERLSEENKELSERVDELDIELHETRIKHDELFDGAEKIIKEKDAEIQRLTTENKELREDCDQLLNVLEIKHIESKAEIQRLTKEVEELKRFKAGIHSEELIQELGGMMNADKKLYESILDSPASFHFNNICNRVRTQGEELTRLRELLDRIKDGPFSMNEEEIIKWKAEVDNALNHKP